MWPYPLWLYAFVFFLRCSKIFLTITVDDYCWRLLEYQCFWFNRRGIVISKLLMLSKISRLFIFLRLSSYLWCDVISRMLGKQRTRTIIPIIKYPCMQIFSLPTRIVLAFTNLALSLLFELNFIFHIIFILIYPRTTGFFT